ncbi:MAG: glycosyltransferase [Anaerolineae bacterium]|nr:MAG: glycosyltransferase [Anaerolineae bacterium]
MRITMVAVGTRGDVQPLIALSLGLQRAGFEVNFATHHSFESFVTGFGLPFNPLAGNPQELIHTEEVQGWLKSGSNPIEFAHHFLQIAEKLVHEVTHDTLAACQGTDAIIFTALGAAAFDIGESMKIPVIGAGLQPITPTRAYPPMLMPVDFNPGNIGNLIGHHAMLNLFYRPVAGHIRAWRKELGLKPHGLRGPFRRVFREKIPILYGYSPSVLPQPPDWPDWHRVTGYWFLDEVKGWQPPAELESFLAAGPPPVYVGFGSMSPRDPAMAADIIIEALEITGQRGILLSGWAGLGRSNLPESIYRLDAAPHDWLFPKMAAVVHHGGAGTTAAGLRAGVPTVTTPFFSDQPFWGLRVRDLGVGPAPVPQKRMTAKRLAAAIRRAVTDPSMKTKAGALGAAIRQEDGIATAVSFIRTYLGH